MTNDKSGWFTGFGGAAPRKGGNYIAPGVYEVELVALTRQISARPDTKGHQLAIAETRIERVITAYPAEVDAHGKVRFPASNAADEKCSTIWNVTKQGDTALGNIKALLLACVQTADLRIVNAVMALRGRPALTEVPPPLADGFRVATDASLTPEEWERLLLRVTEPGDTTLPGLRLRLDAGKTTKRNGDPFTPLRWSALSAA